MHGVTGSVQDGVQTVQQTSVNARRRSDRPSPGGPVVAQQGWLSDRKRLSFKIL